MFGLIPLIRRIRHGMSLGVRVLATDAQGRLLLVRHTYVAGWHLPGGGVDLGETAEDAARRELKEEANVEPSGPLNLAGIHFNPGYGGRNHVVCFHTHGVIAGPSPAPNLEILEVGFFDVAALPDDLSPGTARRIGEWRDQVPPSAHW